jgi:hypothetical protein
LRIVRYQVPELRFLGQVPGKQALSLPLLLPLIDRALILIEGGAGDRSLAVFGVIAGLSILARLDNVFLVGSIVAVVVLSGGQLPRVARRAIPVGLASIALVVPYLLWNRLMFGGFIPISGVVKTMFAPAGLGRIGAQAIALVIGAVALPLVGGRTARASRPILAALSVGAVAHAAYTILRMSSVWTWYFASELLATCWTIALLSDAVALRLTRKFRVPRMISMLASCVAVVGVMGLALRARLVQWESMLHADNWFLEAAAKIDSVVPVGVAVATTVSPGAIGYFSHRSIFAFDGLTLDRGYHYEAARDGLDVYMRRHRIEYLFTVSPSSSEAQSLAAETVRWGQVEDTAYERGADGTAVERLTVFSGVLGTPLGTINLGSLSQHWQGFCSRDVTLFRLN